MAVVLGALIFGVLAGGLSLLMAIPLLFAVLVFAVYSEPWGGAQPVASPEPPKAEPERPRTMVAGRRS